MGLFEFDVEDLKLELPEEQQQPECKGLFFRCSVSSYLSSYNSVETRKSLRLLKRRSCPGCDTCEWMLDFLREDILNEDDFIGNLKPWKIYEYQVKCWGSWDGEDDGCEGEFKEVEE